MIQRLWLLLVLINIHFYIFSFIIFVILFFSTGTLFTILFNHFPPHPSFIVFSSLVNICHKYQSSTMDLFFTNNIHDLSFYWPLLWHIKHLWMCPQDLPWLFCGCYVIVVVVVGVAVVAVVWLVWLLLVWPLVCLMWLVWLVSAVVVAIKCCCCDC